MPRLFAIAAALAAGVSMMTARAETAGVDQRRPTYARDIAPILIERCVGCHRPGRPDLFPLATYEDARARANEIARVVSARQMPPWLAAHAAPAWPALQGDRRLVDRQIAAIGTWAANGAPMGDIRRVPLASRLPMDWVLGVPDMLLTFGRPVHVPADAAPYVQNVPIEIDVPADVWIRAIDFKPSSTGVVRHARLFLAPAGGRVGDDDVLPGVGGLLGTGDLVDFGDRILAAARDVVDVGVWTPGIGGVTLPPGFATRVPPRSTLILQLRIDPKDVDAVEDGRVAIYYAKAGPRRPVIAIDVPPASGFGTRLLIPAAADRHAAGDAFTLPVDVEAVGVRALANHLAREITIAATLPAGRSQGLLRIPAWQMAWTETYFFTAPIRLPKGTVVRSEFVYDNSNANPRNLFTPPRTTGWGHPPVGELMSASLLVVEPPEPGRSAIVAAVASHLEAQLRRR